jgi:PBSX family phage terminase large subunit
VSTQVREHRYNPRSNMRMLLKCRDPEVLLAGPAGTGKSRACLEKLHMMALMNPGMRGLICRKTAATLSSTALVTWRRFVITEMLLTGEVEYYGGSTQEPASYRYSNGSVIAIGGLDKVTKIMSSEYDIVYVQEATELTEDDWESITSRLRNWRVSFQQLMADCNPAQPTHWLKLRCDTGRTTLLETHHEDNPMLFAADGSITDRGADYIKKLDNLTGVRYQRLRQGKWAAAEGVIYDEFLSEVHIIDRLPTSTEPLDAFGVPLAWKRYWGVDFGFVNPFVLQCWAEDGDGRLYMYREIYRTHTTVDVHAKRIMGIVAPGDRWLEPKPTNIVCDHDAEGRAVLEREIGMSTQPAWKAVTEGIEAVQVRLRDPGDGRRRLYLVRDCVVDVDTELKESGHPSCTQEEIPGYVWATNGKDEPMKADDHGCDAMRYVVADRDFGTRALFRGFSS